MILIVFRFIIVEENIVTQPFSRPLAFCFIPSRNTVIDQQMHRCHNNKENLLPETKKGALTERHGIIVMDEDKYTLHHHAG